MRITRTLAGSAAVIAAVAGLGLATAGPAAAASGVWRAYGNTNPITSTSGLETWKCAASHRIAVNVVAQVCGIIWPDSITVQPAVIVRNNKPVLYKASATMDLFDTETKKDFGESDCRLSGVAAHSWSVCFGTTHTPTFDNMDSTGYADNTFLGTSSKF
jgi:hypothetical protein